MLTVGFFFGMEVQKWISQWKAKKEIKEFFDDKETN